MNVRQESLGMLDYQAAHSKKACPATIMSFLISTSLPVNTPTHGLHGMFFEPRARPDKRINTARRRRSNGVCGMRSGAEQQKTGSVSAGNGVATSSQNGSIPERTEEHSGTFEDPGALLKDARIVDVQLPLDAYLEETPSGQVFVDELVPGGNAEKSGAIAEGDIIVAVSLPFGDALFPVPSSNGIDMIRDHMLSRDENEPFFQLAVVSSAGVEVLREQIKASKTSLRSVEEMRDYADKIFVSDYPSAPQRELIEERELDLEALKEAGFDML